MKYIKLSREIFRWCIHDVGVGTGARERSFHLFSVALPVQHGPTGSAEVTFRCYVFGIYILHTWPKNQANNANRFGPSLKHVNKLGRTRDARGPSRLSQAGTRRGAPPKHRRAAITRVLSLQACWLCLLFPPHKIRRQRTSVVVVKWCFFISFSVISLSLPP